MKKESWLELSLYLAVASLSVGAALIIVAQLMPASISQENDNDAIQPPPAQQQPVDAEEPAPEAEEPGKVVEVPFLEPYRYDPQGRRDPFSPFIPSGPLAESSSASGPILPLQQYNLDELKLSAIMWDVKDPKAMFLTPTNEIFVLGKDDRIGRRNGYIAVIREGEVVVVETRRLRGELVYTTRVLKMDDPQ